MNSKKTLLITAISILLLSACGSPEKSTQAYLEKAQKMFDDGEYVLARVEAMNAVQIEPKNVEAHLLLSKLDQLNENYQSMIGHLQVAVDEDPWVLSTRLKLGTWYVRARMPAEAAENAEVAMILGPDDARTHLLNAQIYNLEGKSAELRDAIDRALELDPNLQDAVRFKVKFLFDDGDTAGAIALLDQAIEAIGPKNTSELRKIRLTVLDSADTPAEEMEAELKSIIEDFPDNPNFQLALAGFYMIQQMFAEAESTLQSMIDKNPTDEMARIRFVGFVADTQGTDQAIEVLKGFIEDLPDSLMFRLILGKTYEDIGSTDNALEVYRQIAASSPVHKDGLDARNRIVKITIEQGELDEARRLIDEILADDEDNSEALLGRAAFSFSERAYEDSIADLRLVLRSEETSQRGLLLLARTYLANGDRDLAQDAYRRLLEVNPAHSTASTELARLLARRGDSRLAEDVLRQRLELDPNDRRAAAELVQALLAQGEVDAAETTARNMLELEDESGLAEFELGRVLQAKESGVEAIAAYKLALEKNPTAQQPLVNLIRVFVNNGQTEEAIAHLKNHISEYPKQRTPRFLLGTIYAREGDTETAEKYFEEIIADNPSGIRPYRALAGLYPDDSTTRTRIYLRGVEANPASTVLSLLLANEYEQKEQFDEAIKIYEAVLTAKPGQATILNNLAALLLDHRSDPASHAQALDLMMPFRETRIPAFADTLGWAYYLNGNFMSAIPYLELAVDGADGVPQTHFHLGMAYFSAKNFDSAELELEKAIRLAEGDFPGIEDAKMALDDIRQKTAAR